MACAQDSSQVSSSDIVAAAAAARARKAASHSQAVDLESGGAVSAAPADARALVETLGMRDKLEERWQATYKEARTKMMAACPQCDRRFFDEWSRRMQERVSTDRVMEICAHAFAAHLSQSDIAELTELRRKQLAHQSGQASPELKQKLQTALPAILGDISGEVMKVSVQEGTRIGGEIGREHPEWVPSRGGNFAQ